MVRIIVLILFAVLFSCHPRKKPRVDVGSSIGVEQQDASTSEKTKIEMNKTELLSASERIQVDTTPYRLLHPLVRNKITTEYRHFGNWTLRRQTSGDYYFSNDSLIIRESYPHILLYIGEDYGRLESKIEYYDSNRVLVNTYDLRQNVPLSPEHKEKFTFGLKGSGEFLREVQPYSIPENFKDLADTLLVDIEVALGSASPYRVIDYQIRGLKKNHNIIGCENIIVVLDEKGAVLYQEKFDKAFGSPFIDENNKFLVIGFHKTSYTNPNSKLGDIVIVDLKTGKILLEHHCDEIEKHGGYGFQEVKQNLLFFTLGPQHNLITEELYAIRGLIDFKNRRLYKIKYSKEVYEKKKKENLFFFKEINLSEWELVKSF